MHYQHKWEIFDALKPNFASCEVRYMVDKIPDTIKKRLIKTLRQGYATVRGGDTGTLYKALSRQYGFSRNALFKSTRHPWSVIFSGSNSELFDDLVEHSKADCVAQVLSLSHMKGKSWETPEYFREYVLRGKEHAVCVDNQHWYVGGDAIYTNLFQLKDEKFVKSLVSKHILTDEYNEKIAEAIELLNTPNASLVMEYKI